MKYINVVGGLPAPNDGVVLQGDITATTPSWMATQPEAVQAVVPEVEAVVEESSDEPVEPPKKPAQRRGRPPKAE